MPDSPYCFFCGKVEAGLISDVESAARSRVGRPRFRKPREELDALIEEFDVGPDEPDNFRAAGP